MEPLTLAELRLKQAQLAEQAERVEQTWRTLPTGAKSLAMGKQVKSLKARAGDYALMVTVAERTADGAGIIWNKP